MVFLSAQCGTMPVNSSGHLLTLTIPFKFELTSFYCTQSTRRVCAIKAHSDSGANGSPFSAWRCQQWCGTLLITGALKQPLPQILYGIVYKRSTQLPERLLLTLLMAAPFQFAVTGWQLTQINPLAAAHRAVGVALLYTVSNSYTGQPHEVVLPTRHAVQTIKLDEIMQWAPPSGPPTRALFWPS